jgi:hypothetical protein
MNINIVFQAISIVALSSLFVLAEEKGDTSKLSQLKPGSYRISTNGKYSLETNIDEFWSLGVWNENTNGWRMLLSFWDTNTPNPHILVAVGSKVTNSGGGYFGSPNSKFAKFELLNSNGIIIPPKKGELLEYQFPARMPSSAFPKFSDGGLKNHFGFFSNSPPVGLYDIQMHSVYQIKEEGDYTLTVCAVIYKHETNTEYLDRIDLPCVTAKIHLVPSN